MSTSEGQSIIGGLKGISGCGGNCDCCQNLQNQINALKAEIAAIPRVDEPRIIQQSIAGAEALIIPAVGTLILQQLGPVKAAVALVESKLVSITATAAQALGKAGQAARSP